jgi:hypothetical protein
MPTAIVPGSYDERLADGNLWIETEDAYRMVRRANSPRAANPLLLRQCSPTAPKNT